MDIYLVNSGQCDFYDPPQPLRNALYRNNRDGTFTDVTAKAGVRRQRLRHGRRGRRLRRRRLPGSLRHAVRPQHSLPQQRRRHLHRRHRKGRRGRARLEFAAPCGSTTTTTAGSICLSATSSILDKAHRLRSRQRRCASLLHSAASSSRARAGCFTTTATARSPTSARRPASPSISARPGAWSRPTSTTTAGWTCSSPTTRCPTFSS